MIFRWARVKVLTKKNKLLGSKVLKYATTTYYIYTHTHVVHGQNSGTRTSASFYWDPPTNLVPPTCAHLVELALELHPVQAQGVQETPGNTTTPGNTAVETSLAKLTCQS